MRSFKSGLLTFAVAGFVAMAAVIGCSADGASDTIEDPSPTDPTDEGGSALPPSNPTTSSSSGSTSTKDAGKDAAKQDAAKDAGPPPPNPGDPCTVADTVYTKTCGKCGKAQAICIASDDAGTLKVSDYGACLGETGVCVPGDVQQAACGNCGTLTKTCNNYCAWSSTACGGQPVNSCAPGTTEYTTAGCAVNTYRNHTCGTACTWGGYSTTCAEPVNANKLTISGTVNGTASGSYSLKATQTSEREPFYNCGASATLGTATDYPYEIVELKNPSTTKTATIKVAMTGTPVLEVALAAYPNALPPMDDSSLQNCTDVDWGFSTAWPSLTGLTIAPGAKILIRVQTYYETSQTTYAVTGPFGLTITTTALN
jgi:hypothetical protein